MAMDTTNESNHMRVLALLNLGGEMIYVVAKRLESYKVDEEKTNKILCDLVVNIVNTCELNASDQAGSEPLTVKRLESWFNDAAHASTMRLTDDGLQKLFELSVMTFKYQLHACSYPQEICLLTLNHIDGLRAASAGDSLVEAQVESLRDQFVKVYSALDLSELCALRMNLLNLLTDCKTRVTFLLDWGLQSSDGTFFEATLGPEGQLETVKNEGPQTTQLSELKSILGMNMYCDSARELFFKSHVDQLKAAIAPLEESEKQETPAENDTKSISHLNLFRKMIVSDGDVGDSKFTLFEGEVVPESPTKQESEQESNLDKLQSTIAKVTVRASNILNTLSPPSDSTPQDLLQLMDEASLT
ncbi:Protein oscp1 [Blyttiomyces sp. JEL0837]|nr:Protein oscp1 [Blyttiomyces sp. JEL0837]